MTHASGGSPNGSAELGRASLVHLGLAGDKLVPHGLNWGVALFCFHVHASPGTLAQACLPCSGAGFQGSKWKPAEPLEALALVCTTFYWPSHKTGAGGNEPSLDGRSSQVTLQRDVMHGEGMTTAHFSKSLLDKVEAVIP